MTMIDLQFTNNQHAVEQKDIEYLQNKIDNEQSVTVKDKLIKQLESLKDSIIIYRLSRALI